MRSFRLIPRFVVLVVVGTTITLGAGTATAADCKKNIAVTDAGDAAAPTSGQLRTAIAELCSGGTILLPAGVIIDLAQGELVIPSGKVLTIRSPSHQQQATIDAQGTSRVFWVQVNASLSLRNVIVRGGDGAGINNDGSLTVTGGAVRDNAGVGIVNNASGLVTLSGDTSVAANDFSGVFNLGELTDPPSRLTLEDHATITGNAGTNGGGIFNTWGTITLNDQSSVRGNTATFGGGIYAGFGLVTLNDDSSIQDNEASGEGGGIYNPAGPIAGNVLNDRSRITGNVGGGIGGRGHITLNDDATVADNVGTGIDNVRGGVILNDRSSVAGNEGDGVSAFGVGVTMNDQSRISDNEGGGIGVFDASAHLNDESAVTGNDNGGVWVSFGLLALNGSSTISGNTSQGAAGGVVVSEGQVTLNDNGSIVNNVGMVGGIFNRNFGPVDPSECPSVCVTLNGSSTITGNVATGGAGGGIYNENGGTVIVNDNGSITGNSPDDCYPPASC
jgi:hypothetical protein